MSPTERAADDLLATLVVHGEMLRGLWVHLLAEGQHDPIDTGDACQSTMLDEMEEAFDNATDPGVEALRQVAITKMEEMWTDIMAGVRELVGPTDLRPTDYGNRVADRAAQTGPSPPADDVPDR